MVISEVPFKYKNMDLINFGILGLPKEYWVLPEMHVRAYILKRRYERFFSLVLNGKLSSTVL